MRHISSFEYKSKKPKFKVGDYVVCIDDKDNYLMKNGNIYQISNVHKNEFTHEVFYKFDELSNSSGWNENRFRKATEEEVAMKKYNL